MKISILTSNFSGNCFGRTWLLAKLLQNNFDVEVIGPAFGNGIWKPLINSCDFPVGIVNGYSNGQFEFKKMLRLISGNVIYASKPLMASFGVGLVKKLLTWKPLVLDIDDWELGFGKEFYDSLPWYKKINDFRISRSDFRSYYYSVIMDRFIPFVNAITVAGDVLRKKYGGTVVWHGRDSEIFDPAKYNSNNLKKKYLNLSDKAYIVSFIGTPRPHKGLEDLINAIEILNKKQIFLLIIGINENEYCRKLIAKIESSTIKDRVILFPEQPFELLPEYLAISDLIVIPQRETSSSYGQVPAKIFDAMAMAKPILASNLYDIPNILNGCGRIIEPGNKLQLIKGIKDAYDNTDIAKEIAYKARRKFLEQYSWKILRNRINPIFEKLSFNV